MPTSPVSRASADRVLTSATGDEYEEALHRRCVKHLDQRYPGTPRQGTIGIKYAGTDQQRKVRGYIAKLAGNTKGWPELLICKRGKRNRAGLAIEFKSRDGKQSAEQRAVQKKLEEEGYTYTIVRTMETFDAELTRQWPAAEVDLRGNN